MYRTIKEYFSIKSVCNSIKLNRINAYNSSNGVFSGIESIFKT